MQNEDETNVPTGDELFEQPAEFASGEGHALGIGEMKVGSIRDVQSKGGVRPRKGNGGNDVAMRRPG